jgi:hypothetical protein
MEKIWKLYNDKTNVFFNKSFEDNKYLSEYHGFDFIYNEIYNWEHSESGCIYEMWDCIIKQNDVVVDLGANSGFFSIKSAELAFYFNFLKCFYLFVTYFAFYNASILFPKF